MKLTATVKVSQFKTKLRKWMKEVDAEQAASLTGYGRDFLKEALKFTPPGNGKQSPARSLKDLRERIRRDFEGDAGKDQALQDEDIRWITLPSGERTAFIPVVNAKGQVVNRTASPFRAVAGRVTQKKLRALHVGKYHVEFTGADLGAFIALHPGQYKFRKNRAGRVTRMVFRGARHLAPERSIKAEIRRRQALVGRLLAGWKPLARHTRTKLPAAAEKHNTPGSVSVQVSAVHGAVLTAVNSGGHFALQQIIDRNLPKIRKAMKRGAKGRVYALRKKLRAA